MRAIVAMLILSALALAARAQDVVELRTEADLTGAGPVHLGDIADLKGPGAEALAGIVIADHAPEADAHGWASVDAAMVRAALRDAPGVNWGRLVVRGSSCALRCPQAPPKPDARAGAKPEEPAAPGETVRSLVERRMADMLGVDPEALRLSFDDQDKAALNTSVEGRTADIQLVGSSERQPVSVKLYDGMRQVLSATVRVGVSVRRSVAVATAGLRRGDTLTTENTLVEERWVSPTLRCAEAERAIGRVAKGRLDAGSVVEDSDIESPVLVKKGDLVDVYCLSGSVSLKIVARALDGGREGETIRFQAAGAKRPFTARVDGPARAVTGVGAAPADGPEEAPAAPRSPSRKPPGAGNAIVKSNAARTLRYADLGDRPVVKSGKAPASKE